MDGLSHFCVMCFADESDGSWGHVTIPESNYCTNCSSGGTLIQIPRGAVESIRRNASWVGKRYYPADEDSISFREREELLKLVQSFPGRSAKALEDESGRWEVSQRSPDRRTTSTWVSAESGDDALRRAKSLTYYSEDQLADS